jgi:putative copper resistance protein D
VPDIWGLAAIATKFFLYLGVLTSGGLIFCNQVFSNQLSGIDRFVRAWAAGFGVLAVAMSVLGFTLRGAVLMDDVSGMIDPSILALLWETPPGDALILRILGLGVMLVGLAVGGLWLWVATLGSALAIWSFSKIGHVAIEGLFWFQVVLFTHLMVASFWVGVLLPLQKLSRSSESLTQASDLGHRFGQIASVAVPLLLVAGVIMTWRLVGSVSSMIGTSYGLMLLAKIGAVAVLLALAAINKVRLVPALRAGDPTIGPRLTRSISLEWLCVWVILLTTAIFTSVLAVPS